MTTKWEDTPLPPACLQSANHPAFANEREHFVAGSAWASFGSVHCHRPYFRMFSEWPTYKSQWCSEADRGRGDEAWWGDNSYPATGNACTAWILIEPQDCFEMQEEPGLDLPRQHLLPAHSWVEQGPTASVGTREHWLQLSGRYFHRQMLHADEGALVFCSRKAEELPRNKLRQAAYSSYL